MKRFLALLLALMMVLALTACGEAKPESAAPAEGASGEPSFQGSYLLGTGSATGNYYNFGNAVCTVINPLSVVVHMVPFALGLLTAFIVKHYGRTEVR